jgi:DNA-binding CsgD family transcriptional regulator
MSNERRLITPHLMGIIREQIPTDDLYAILNNEPNTCISVKSQTQGYIYSNNANLALMGYQDLKKFIYKKDKELTSDKKLLKIYDEVDDFVYTTEKSLQIEGDVSPDQHPNLVKTMVGAQYPLHVNSNKADAILIVVRPKNKLITLSLEHLITFSSTELQQYLRRTSYKIQLDDFELRLSRMELLSFAEMLKGNHAGETAETLNIKQITVESYLSNLRSKCGVSKKSELIHFFVDHHILERIVV